MRWIDTISDLRKTFYKTMLMERYQQVLLPPYQKTLSQGFLMPDCEWEKEEFIPRL